MSPLGVIEDRTSGADLDASPLTKAYGCIALLCGGFGLAFCGFMSFGFSFFTAAVTVPFVMAVLAGVVVSAREFSEGVVFVAHRVVAYGRVGSCGGSTA